MIGTSNVTRATTEPRSGAGRKPVATTPAPSKVSTAKMRIGGTNAPNTRSALKNATKYMNTKPTHATSVSVPSGPRVVRFRRRACLGRSACSKRFSVVSITRLLLDDSAKARAGAGPDRAYNHCRGRAGPRSPNWLVLVEGQHRVVA